MNNKISIPFGEHSLSATVYNHSASARKGCILYFHGGGLVFGTSDDLPSLYLNGFRQAGYDFISLSYPLAPETRLSTILDAAVSSVIYILEHPQVFGYDTMPPYFLFGRSAGAYLALNVAHRLSTVSCSGAEQHVDAEQLGITKQHAAADQHIVSEQHTTSEHPAITIQAEAAVQPPVAAHRQSGLNQHYPCPAGILSFYGYHTFDIPEFHKPNPAYLKFPAVPEHVAAQLSGQSFLTEGPKETRYSIYIYARQTGKWTDLLGAPEGLAAYSLSEQDLSQLPPCFFTASSSDQDVPFRTSKYMASKVPGSIFRPVYYLEHDFDRDIRCKEGRKIYEAAIAWMEMQLKIQNNILQ